jgi:hypothetical protein
VPQIVIGFIVDPAGYRIGAKGKNERGDGTVDIGIVGDSHDFGSVHVHGSTPAFGKNPWL